jgi:hypothetical protein
LFPIEAIRSHIDISSILNTWAANYGLPQRSIVVTSGNYSFGTQIKKDKCIVYIPFSMWGHITSRRYSDQVRERLTDNIKNKIPRQKVFLNYNRKARADRCRLVYHLKESDVLNFGLVSLGNTFDVLHPDIPNDFYKCIPMTFDDTDLEINHAGRFTEKDFSNSYVSLVSETYVDPGNVFPTEKIFKAVLGMHPFIILGSPGFLLKLKEMGYKTFSRWFDEKYDTEMELEERTKMIVTEIKKLTLMSKPELDDMMLEMLPYLHHNILNFVKRSKEKTFQEELEKELWR